MWRVASNVLEMLVYASVYLIIVLVASKILGASFSADFEQKISEGSGLGYALICGAMIIGMAILLASIVR
ncbi:MAG: hypothetical protein H6Q55_1195 [Deltaproteobacteria bacterium]|jgi:hypothetical protein|nr:hypothetical protein [Deltaproteobacteria bacterium]